MSVARLMQTVMAETHLLPLANVTVFTEPLTNQEETEVIAFLAERPLHTVCMAGLIRDNGLESILCLPEFRMAAGGRCADRTCNSN